MAFQVDTSRKHVACTIGDGKKRHFQAVSVHCASHAISAKSIDSSHPMLLPAAMGSCEISLSADAKCALVLPSMAVLELS